MTEKIRRQFQMFVPDDDGSAMDWLENTLQAERDRIVEEIKTLRERIIGGRAMYQLHNWEKVEVSMIEDIINLINNK